MPEPAAASAGGVAVVAAMREEIRPLRRRLETIETWTRGRVECRRGRLRGTEIFLAATGDGRANAERGLRHVVDRHRPEAILVLGLAGALSPALAVGDVVLATEVRDRGRVLDPPDGAWLARARLAAGASDAWQPGRVVTVDEILDSPPARARWLGGERAPPAAVADLESAAYARVAGERGLPYLVARAVSDRADESLPAFLNRCFDGGGGIDRRRVVRLALTRPSSWRALVRLRSRMTRCALRLADVAERLLAVAAPAGAPDG